MNKSEERPKVSFITSNNQKFREIELLFQKTSIELSHLKTTLVEIQADDLEVIAIHSIKSLNKLTKNNIIFVEDSGLFIKKLNFFPGPYSSFVYKTIGLEGVLKLMKQVEDRSAFFQSSIALRVNQEIKVFTGIVKGMISLTITDSGWGYDPIFIPDNNGSLTYGELGSRKNFISHRFHATIKLIDYLKNYVFQETE